MREKYVKKLVICMKEAGLDAVMLCPGEEMEFLAGFRPMMCERFQGLFVKADGSMFYICNLLYEDEFRKELPDSVPLYAWFDGEVMTEVVGGVLKEHGLLGKKIGVNSDAQAFNILEIMDKVDVTFCNAKPLLEEMRIHKDEEELENLRASARVVDQVFTEVLPLIKPGVTEKAIQEFLLRRMSELGGKSPECIVGVGANSSYPHYSDNKGVIGEQDVVLMDYGCQYHGYLSDMTRTLVVGKATPKQKEVYRLEQQMVETIENYMKVGASIKGAYEASVEVIRDTEYYQYHYNGIGHGVGMFVHEIPFMGPRAQENFHENTVMTVEPGIYIPGWGGIRIEDQVLIKENGIENLISATKELIEL